MLLKHLSRYSLCNFYLHYPLAKQCGTHLWKHIQKQLAHTGKKWEWVGWELKPKEWHEKSGEYCQYRSNVSPYIAWHRSQRLRRRLIKYELGYFAGGSALPLLEYFVYLYRQSKHFLNTRTFSSLTLPTFPKAPAQLCSLLEWSGQPEIKQGTVYQGRTFLFSEWNKEWGKPT